jgi:hypothetical protein
LLAYALKKANNKNTNMKTERAMSIIRRRKLMESNKKKKIL